LHILFFEWEGTEQGGEEKMSLSKTKVLAVLVIGLFVGVGFVPSINGNIDLNQKLYNELIEQDLEIKIMGPLTNPHGYLVYCEIINHGPDTAYIIPDMKLYTLLTNEPISDSTSIPVEIMKGEIYTMAYTHSWWFGFGLGRIEITINGWGEFYGTTINALNLFFMGLPLVIISDGGADIIYSALYSFPFEFSTRGPAFLFSGFFIGIIILIPFISPDGGIIGGVSFVTFAGRYIKPS